MSYDFRSLLPADFLDLAVDIVGKSLGVDSSAGFKATPKSGVLTPSSVPTFHFVKQCRRGAERTMFTVA